MKHAVVVGAGFGGIASALRLKGLGYHVTLIDRLDQLGGRARVFHRGGYKHDAGPTVLTAPFLFEELFALFDERIEDYAQIVPLQTWYDFYFSDGRTFRYQADLKAFEEEIGQFCKDDVAGYAKLVAMSEKIFNVGFTQLADVPFNTLSTMVKQVPSLIRLQSYKTVYQLIATYIQHPSLRQALSIHSLLVGGNPFDTTSIYTLIHFLERKWGIHFCMGGTGALVAAFKKLMLKVGVTIQLQQEVKQIQVKQNKVVGWIDQNGHVHSCDLMVFNGDPAFAYQHLLPKLPRQFFRRPDQFTQFSMGLYVLFFGATKQWPEVAHHTIWMGHRYKTLLHDIFHKKILADDFSLYIHRPTATDPSFAPQGCDSFYVLCPVPNLLGKVDWEHEAPRLKTKIIDALDQTILPQLKSHIEASFWMTPEDFQTDYLSTYGAGFSIAPILTQSAYFRFHNQDPSIKNLFFAGAGTHPGAGLPGVVSSAKVVEKLVRQYQTTQGALAHA